MFGIFRKKRKQRQTPQWLVWLTIIFIAYAVLSNSSKKIASSATPTPTTTENPATLPTAPSAEELSLGAILEPSKIFNIDAVKGKIIPQKSIRFYTQNKTDGTGEAAVCGQKVTINYNSFIIDENDFEKGKEVEKIEKFTFQLGEDKVMPALERGVIGMQKNGKRNIFSPNNMAYTASGFTRDTVPAGADIRFDVELLDISPELPDYSAFRVLGDAPRSTVFPCGKEVKLHVSLWNLEGKKIYDTKEKDNNSQPITFTIGESEVFFGLEQGALGMSVGMRRNLIVPPSMQKPLYDNKQLVDFPFPKNQTVIVDIESALPPSVQK